MILCPETTMKLRLNFWLSTALMFGALIVGTVTICSWKQPPQHRFETLDDIEAFAKKNGLYVYRVDRSEMGLQSDLYISENPISIERLPIWKGKFDTDPRWKKLVWVYELQPPENANCTMLLIPEQDACRVWENVVVLGDRDLLNRLEQARLEP